MNPDIDRTVAALADALRRRGLTMATAESCTGGLIAGACTDLAGSSDWFERGVVSYSNRAKTELLGVPAALIAAHGAVSEPVALAVAVTGVAGPGGGTATKPVGLVWLAWAWRDAAGAVQVQAQAQQFTGDRAAVRAATVQCALQGVLARAGQAAMPAAPMPPSASSAP